MQSYTYAGGASGFIPGSVLTDATTKVTQTLPPYSITVLDVQLNENSPVAK